MKPTVMLWGVMAAGLAAVAPGQAEPLRYWGKFPEGTTGLIELGPSEYSVRPGTEIPAWGRVKAVTDQHLIVEQGLTEEEKARLREHGALAHDVLEIHVPREDLRQPRGHVLPPVTR